MTKPQGILEHELNENILVRGGRTNALVKLQGVLTDTLTAGERFTIIHDSPTVQFNVLSGRAAPQVSSNHSAIFTIVENLNGVDYYVTKVINPDGREVVVNTEQV